MRKCTAFFVVAYFEDENSDVRGEVARASGSIGDKGAIPALEKAAREYAYNIVSRAAREAVEKLRKQQ